MALLHLLQTLSIRLHKVSCLINQPTKGGHGTEVERLAYDHGVAVSILACPCVFGQDTELSSVHRLASVKCGYILC